ncbi:unnamed protein product [Parascedosporium putredinis]|uniref:Amine oxidase domain-containing protein n=1 Tax=Parascedosporium putredinis TaxID=1442378 RepID=A0A9P1GWF8_9PEZI|nr:unnamed protein product [Parascedosporium putredinis]CAI7988806.1 unnamed protein product [Parascedosporium putredinis]
MAHAAKVRTELHRCHHAGLPQSRVFLGTAVESLANEPDGKVRLQLSSGGTPVYDHVILATHGDQAWSIVRNSATAEEKSIMPAFKTSLNKAVLHSDLSLLPQNPKAWSCWNYITKSSPTGKANIDTVCLTYNMNLLQHIPVTPLGVSYIGAWTKYGFHEDGFSSGLAAAERLGAKLPFEFKDSTFSRGRRPEIGLRDLALRLILILIHLLIIHPLERVFASKRRSRGQAGAAKRKHN